MVVVAYVVAVEATCCRCHCSHCYIQRLLNDNSGSDPATCKVTTMANDEHSLQRWLSVPRRYVAAKRLVAVAKDDTIACASV